MRASQVLIVSRFGGLMHHKLTLLPLREAEELFTLPHCTMKPRLAKIPTTHPAVVVSGLPSSLVRWPSTSSAVNCPLVNAA